MLPAATALPNRLVLMPLTGKPMFPGMLSPLVASPGGQTATVDAAMELGGFLGLVLTRDPDAGAPAPDRLHRVGTAARIVRKMNLPDGGLNVFISTIARFRVAKIMDPGPPVVAAALRLDDTNMDSDEVHALARALISEMKQVSEGNPLFSEEMRLNMVNIDHPGKIADFLTSILNIDREQQQRILEQLDVRARMEQVLVFIKKEQELLKIQKRIQGELEEKISKSQRQYFLREQMKAIKAELGMAVDAKSGEYQRFKEAFEEQRIHVHIPAGATPKDGPSAGITIASALLSLACGKRYARSLAMTGELSLVGDVLPVGGLKEKVIAAQRSRIRAIIIPQANQADVADIPERARRGIDFQPVRAMEEVVEIIL